MNLDLDTEFNTLMFSNNSPARDWFHLQDYFSIPVPSSNSSNPCLPPQSVHWIPKCASKDRVNRKLRTLPKREKAIFSPKANDSSLFLNQNAVIRSWATEILERQRTECEWRVLGNRTHNWEMVLFQSTVRSVCFRRKCGHFHQPYNKFMS